MSKLKEALYITDLYERATATSLDEVYGRYSAKKKEAFEYCRNLMAKYNGWGLKILSHNTFVFTAGFEFVSDETGAVNIMYITPSKDTAVEWTR